MKRLLQILITGVVCLGAMSGSAAAVTASSCSISGTGAGSTNVCQFDVNDNIIYTCLNDILVVNGTSQTSTSGVVQSSNNTSVGNVSSGSAINNGQTTTNAQASCVPAATTAATPTSTPPVTGGQGGGEVATAPVTPAPVKAAVLPKTGSNNMANEAVIGVSIAAGIMVAAQLGVQAYRRFALK